jgi:hypothetical protein
MADLLIPDPLIYVLAVLARQPAADCLGDSLPEPDRGTPLRPVLPAVDFTRATPTSTCRFSGTYLEPTLWVSSKSTRIQVLGPIHK